MRVSTLGAGLTAALLLAPAPALADPQLSRTVNLDGPRTTPPGTLDFAFTHRFQIFGGAIANSPTFLLDAGVTPTTQIGLAYATASRLGAAPQTAFTRVVPANNEFQLSVKQGILSQAAQGVDLAAMLAYDTTSNSGDASLLVSRDLGPFLTVLGAIKGFSNGFGAGGYTAAGGLGLQVHLTPNLEVTEDFNGVLGAQNSDRLLDPTAPQYYSALPAWSAAVAFRIPYSPHTVQLYLTNADTITLEGSSRGVLDAYGAQGTQSYVRGGFEFDVPFSDAGRWLAIFQPPPARSGSAPPAPVASAVVATESVVMGGFAFDPARLQIRPGTAVTWTNRTDPVAHTVTADDGFFDSGPIDPGSSWSRVFTAPGTYSYHCTPHPFMKGTVVVQ